jgi:S-adenosylmethionine decarboxylase
VSVPLDRSLGLPQPIRPTAMRLHAVDAWVHDPAALVDRERVRSTLFAAAEAAGTTVVGEQFHVFANGAVTGVLLLAQSHLSIHTWPEHRLANVDLLSYGDAGADELARSLADGLGTDRFVLTTIPRAIG